jgi:hypothetical protein
VNITPKINKVQAYYSMLKAEEQGNTKAAAKIDDIIRSSIKKDMEHNICSSDLIIKRSEKRYFEYATN